LEQNESIKTKTMGKGKIQFGIILLSTLLLGLASCAPRVPFTQNVRDKYQLSAEDLKSIQFYNSEDIVLNRGKKSQGDKTTDEGMLTVKDGQYIEQVVIKRGTPCVVEKVVGTNKLAVTFEDGQRFLVFGNPSNNSKGKYTLLASEWNGSRGKLSYGEHAYVTNTNADAIYLEFRMKKMQEFDREQRVVKGRKL